MGGWRDGWVEGGRDGLTMGGIIGLFDELMDS